MSANDKLSKARMDAEITTAEFADFIGADRRWMYRIEIGVEPAPEWMLDALHRMVEARSSRRI